MLPIGKFSALSNIGIRTLRYYAALGLLEPAYIDEASNYRYYKEEQLVLANRIEALRSMGLSLREIGDILKDYESAERLRELLLRRIAQKEAEILKAEEQLQLLKEASGHLEDEGYRYAFNITVKEFPRRRIVRLRRRIASYQMESALWRRLSDYAAKQRISFSSPPFNIAVYHDGGFREGEVDVEVQRGISASSFEREGETGAVLPADFISVRGPVLAATVTMRGELSFYRGLNRFLPRWLMENDYEPDGPMFSIYHVAPKAEREAVVEVCYPIKKSGKDLRGRQGRRR